jgi:NAD(P)-dependent dehydrogenase (short-subunit alcohol dehydrogenase family)
MNNAGVMALPKRQVTTDGLEMQMGVNHFGHFHLTNLMMPYINAAPGRKRIVNLSSVVRLF